MVTCQLPPDVNRRLRTRLDAKPMKKPGVTSYFGCFWIFLEVEVVAMGGIEPPTPAL